VELFNIFAEEENIWYERTHWRWLLEGDQNVAYFHRLANGRERKNAMHFVDDNGVLIER
jgi:hypothetical protein